MTASFAVDDNFIVWALEPASAISPALTASPTITTPAQMTGVGMLLGTAAYMSPRPLTLVQHWTAGIRK